MELRPSEEQQQLVAAFAALYAKESPAERVRAAEPLGFDPRLWDRLVEQGSLAMAVDEAHGGWGASVLDLALVAEQHGRALGAAPLIETQVACRLLARVGTDRADALLADALAGRAPGHGGPSAPPGGRGRRWSRPGRWPPTCWWWRTDGWWWSPPATTGWCPRTRAPCRWPMCPWRTETPAGWPTGRWPTGLLDAALDDWLVLTAAALVGIADRSVEIGVEYAGERQAFGQLIGSFQGVGHRLADCATRASGAGLLAREAAWAVAEDPGRSGELAAMAFAFAAECARDASDWSLHFHGGYGFMLEYDIQLYYRRARAWANVVMSPAAACRRVADRRYGAAAS